MVDFSKKINGLFLEIIIVANKIEYTVIFTEKEVKSIDFNLDIAKAKIPIILHLKNRERIDVRNFIAYSVTNYIKQLNM